MCLNLQVYPSDTLSMGYFLKKGKKKCYSLKFGFLVDYKKMWIAEKKTENIENTIVKGVVK